MLSVKAKEFVPSVSQEPENQPVGVSCPICTFTNVLNAEVCQMCFQLLVLPLEKAKGPACILPLKQSFFSRSESKFPRPIQRLKSKFIELDSADVEISRSLLSRQVNTRIIYYSTLNNFLVSCQYSPRSRNRKIYSRVLL